MAHSLDAHSREKYHVETMWSGTAGIPQAPGIYGGTAVSSIGQTAQAGNQKHDIFVGNLAFNTTEEQLHQAFSEIGRVINVRLVTDVDTGKPRGYAFVEFADPQAALSAIRNMNDYELNGRRLRVNYSNSSHLEQLAAKLGMDPTQQTQRTTANSQPQPASVSPGTNAVADALKNMSKAEMYDVVAKLKEIADRDPDEARRIISGHPQLPEALLFLMSKLDMVKTPVAAESPAAVLPTTQLTTVRAADPRAAVRADPRQAAAAAAAAAVVAAPAPAPPQVSAPPPAPTRVDPRQRVDPRAAARAAATTSSASAAPPVPPQPQQQPPPPLAPHTYGGVPPPPPPPPPPLQQQQPASLAHLDPSLVQQVMSLTPQQIQQLPPDKQQSILQLRQQITGGTGM